MAIFQPVLTGTVGDDLTTKGFTLSPDSTGASGALVQIATGGAGIRNTAASGFNTYLAQGANAPASLQDQELRFVIDPAAAAAGTADRLVLRYSDTSNYIYLRSAGGTGQRVYALNAGAPVVLVSSVAALVKGEEYIFRVQGSTVSLIRVSTGTDVFTPVTDAAALPAADGYPGIMNTGSAGVDPWLSDWESRGVGETSGASDTTPDAITIASQTNVARSTVITSETKTLTGTDADAPISVDVGEYAISTDGGTTWGTWTATAGTIPAGATYALRHTSSGSFSANTVQTVTIGGVAGTFTSTTLAGESYPITIRVTDSAGATADLATSITVGPAASGGIEVGDDPPLAVTSASWASEAEQVWNLSSEANTGYRTAPTKTPGVDALPSGASLTVVNANSSYIILAAGGGTFSGWNMGGCRIIDEGGNWIIEDNHWLIPVGTEGTYVISLRASNSIVRYNTTDADFEFNSPNTHIHVVNAGTGNKVYRNRLLKAPSDTFKLLGTDTSTAGRVEVYENYITHGSWVSDAVWATLADPDKPHFDSITVAQGGANIHHNFFDLTPYTTASPSNRLGFASGHAQVPRNTPPADAPANTHTRGLTNFVRVQADSDGHVIDNVTVHRNIVRGHKRGGNVTMMIADKANTATEGAVFWTDNIMQDGYRNQLGSPALPDDPTFSLTFTGNTRYPDGVGFTAWTGETAVAPGPTTIDSIVNVTASSFQLVYDKPGDSLADGGTQYALSTDGGGTFGAWATLANDHVITGLSSATSYHVKVRGTNANGDGPESNVLAVTTA